MSAHFLASEYCAREAATAMKRAKADDCVVVPVILKECDWTSRWGELEALPMGGRAIGSWEKPDKAFANVALSLRRWITERQEHRPADPEAAR